MGIWFQLLMIDSNWMMIDDDRVTILERYLSERLPGGGGLWQSGGGVLKVKQTLSLPLDIIMREENSCSFVPS